MGQVSKIAMEDAQDITDTREHRQAVAEANQLVVAGVRPEIILIHDEQPGRRDGWSQAYDRLTTETESRTGLFLTHTRSETTYIHIALAARISRQVAV